MTENHGVIPVLLERCTLPFWLTRRVLTDLTDEYDREHQLDRLILTLRGRAQTSAAQVPGDEPAARPVFRNFDIELAPSEGDRYRLRGTCPDLDIETEQLVTVPFAELQTDVKQVRRGMASRSVWEDVGRRLYRTIFTPEMTRAWDKAAAVSNVEGHHILRLRLRMDGPRLVALPWELLQKESFSLAMAQPVARYNGEIHMPVDEEDRRPLNLLVADTAARRGSRTVPAIRQHLATLQASGRIGRLEVLERVSFADLQAALSEGGYDILHVVAETSRQDGSHRLVLHDGNGGTLPVEGERFAYVAGDSPIRLLVLSAADSATAPEEEEGLTDAAIGAHRAGVPAVVVVQGKVGHQGTIAFASAFYEQLAKGCPVEAGMTAGRNAIVKVEGLHNPKWALPLLFNDEPDVIAFGLHRPRDCFDLRADLEGIEAAAGGRHPAGTVKHKIGDDFRQEVIGRNDALSRIARAFAAPGANNVVVKSAPGFGKPAVARQFAWEAAHPQRGARRYDSVTWISPATAKTADPGDVLRGSVHQITADLLSYAALEALGALSESAGDSPLLKIELPARLREIATLFARGHHLILIDDVSPGAEDAVRTFIEAMPHNVHFVVTSMRRLGIGEHEVELGPLPQKDMRALIAGIAGGRAPGDSTFGGNPFIAAVETRRLLARGDPLLIPTGDGAVAAYTRVLFANALSNENRRVLAVCIELPFAADRFIVQHASDLDESDFDAVSKNLIDLGLLERRNHTLVLSSTLPALFRDGEEEALRELPDVKVAAVRALMAFLDHVYEQTGSPEAPEFTRAINEELGNLVWGVRTAYDLGMFALLRGFRNFLQDSLYNLGFRDTALQIGELAFLAASHFRDHEEMAWTALYPLTRIHYQRQELRAAERWCVIALSLFENIGEPRGLMSAKRYLGRIRQSEGDFEKARTLFTQILEDARRRSAPRDEISMSVENLAALELAAGRFGDAERRYEEALQEQEPGPKRFSALYELGRLALRRDVEKALEYFFEARGLIAGAVWDVRYAKNAYAIGLAYEQKGDYVAACNQFRIAHEVYNRAGSRADVEETDAALVRVIALHEQAVRA